MKANRVTTCKTSPVEANSLSARPVSKPLMGHVHAWTCPEILWSAPYRRFSRRVCAQTADRLEFWVVDLPAHKQTQ